MCGRREHSKSEPSSTSTGEAATNIINMDHLTVKTEYCFSSLLELASNNDVEVIKGFIDQDASSIEEVGLWYCREKGSKQIVAKHRTPLMVAATYGSVDVVKLIVTHSAAVNQSCGADKSTALHCAASGGSLHAIDVVNLLFSAGADPNCSDAFRRRPADVLVVHPKLQGMRGVLEELLSGCVSDDPFGKHNLWISIDNSASGSLTLSSSLENGSSPSASNLASSPMASKFIDIPVNSATERKEYPVDPSLPDIKNSIYATDEFRMFSFKIRPCSRAYSHDWTECPFVHPGENARRRDPRKYHYSCVPCSDFRKGSCRRGDMCEYAHGVFECWLHPTQYRTRICKDGTSCDRRVCFFAHTAEELRPLYVSTGSAVASPRAAASAASAMDMAAVMSLLPGSPSSVSVVSPSPFNQYMSPSANGLSHSSPAWPQPNVPTLHLPGSNFQSSRLRSSLSARDIPLEDFDMWSDFDAQEQNLNDLPCFSQSLNSPMSLSRSGRSRTLTPSDLKELFSAEISSSPRYADRQVASAIFSPTHNSALLNQFQQQQSKLSPINTGIFAHKNVEHPLLQASFGVGSPGRMSPRCTEPISPIAARLSAHAQYEKHRQQLGCLSSRELGSNNPATIVGSPVNSSLSKWGSLNGKLNWSVSADEMGQLRRSSSLELGKVSEEPDLSWVQSLVKEPQPEVMKEKLVVPVPHGASSGEVSNDSNSQIDSIIGAWIEQMQLDQLVV
ncbi:Zinc finger CCCH domain-containing protein 30 [Hibiscus syriacus]|uniref:Zinc finger CCCH domain-containing protein 30 n=1 Tax=Hibiscus syriacus TaxID=106335 RepID=A0A6A2XA56_HIBSY|nr:zinc finger CCCH domain-containing protein 30-like [Hibiscus syriacus]XP_039035878.1 zinc finger CCCH domain-containing protein 30-like [Hibiscus syriacus]KAE8672142.1 Zinc finger CCCH domain-containing protein 30 [Hibiscus syriacus]